MQFKLSFAFLALATLVAANPLEHRQAADPNAPPAAADPNAPAPDPYAAAPAIAPAPPTYTDCDTGNIQCCQSTSNSASSPTASLLGSLGIVAQGVDILVGLTCTPLTIIGLQSGGW